MLLRLLRSGLFFAAFFQFGVAKAAKSICEIAMAREGSDLTSAEAKATQSAMRGFGFEVHKEVQSTMNGKSLVTSPFSIMSMLGILYNGAEGKTYEEMTAGLHLKGMDRERFNIGYKHLTDSLKKVSEDNIFSYGNLSAIDQRFKNNPQFVADVVEFLGAAAERWDFRDEDALVKRFNDYIEQKTNGMIKDLLSIGDAPDMWGLVNAGFFKASWATEFKVEETQEDGVFKLAGGQTKNIPLMSFYGTEMLYFSNSQFDMVSLPYKNADFTMDVILPKLNGQTDVAEALMATMKQLNAETYDQAIKSLKKSELDLLQLPRWEIKSELRGELKLVLMQKMPSVFSNANFSRMLTAAPQMGTVIHASVVETNEKGSKGAFVTFGGGLESIRSNPTFVANRPFLAVIRHVPTGVPVFIITEFNPEALPKPKESEKTQITPLIQSVNKNETLLNDLTDALLKSTSNEQTIISFFSQYYDVSWTQFDTIPTFKEKVKAALKYTKEQKPTAYTDRVIEQLAQQLSQIAPEKGRTLESLGLALHAYMNNP